VVFIDVVGGSWSWHEEEGGFKGINQVADEDYPKIGRYGSRFV